MWVAIKKKNTLGSLNRSVCPAKQFRFSIRLLLGVLSVVVLNDFL